MTLTRLSKVGALLTALCLGGFIGLDSTGFLFFALLLALPTGVIFGISKAKQHTATGA